MLSTSDISNEDSSYHASISPLTNFQTTASYFQLATGMEAILPYDSGVSSDSSPETGMPYLEIIVKPTDKFRFRYKSESGSHGKLRGKGNKSKTNYPSVKLHNYDSNSKIEIKASLYTNEANPRPHVLELVGKNCSNGICSEILSEDNVAVFQYLEIESKKKDELIRLLSQNKRDFYGNGNYDEESIKREALDEYKSLNTNAARLCFEAFQGDIPVCEKVFSDPILNLKSASSDLKIVRLSLVAGRCSGGEDMILLCNKVNKDDIKIRFYEKDENDAVLWEDYAAFNKPDVHFQVAIAFRTPRYYQNTEKLINIELFRPSDEQSGDALKFTYIPDEIDALRFSKKRKYDSIQSVLSPQNLMQATSSSQFTSPFSNMSSEPEEDLFQGSPSTSSSNEFPSDANFFEQLIRLCSNDADMCDTIDLKTLTDSDNFLTTLERGAPIEMSEDTQPVFENEDDLNLSMDCAGELRTVFSDQHDMGEHSSMGKATLTLTSGESDDLFYKSLAFASKVGDSLISFVKNPLSSFTGIHAAAGKTAVSNSDFRKAQGSVVYGQMGTVSNIDYKKSFLPQSYGNAAEHIDANNKTRDIKKLGGSSKKSDTNKNFEQFKKGIYDILRNRKTDAFVRYVANLMSVEDENGNLLLHLAVLEQSENINLIAKIFEMAPQNVNKQNKFKETCLHFATMKDSSKVLLYLMAHNGNPGIKNQDGDNCFHIAAKSNFFNSMKMLLLSNLKFGKPIPSLDDLNYDGLSPLHLSIMNNAKECMQLLLQAGANVNAAERKTGSSPLHLAISLHPSLIGPLLCHPAIDTNCTDFRGCTAYQALLESKGLITELLEAAQKKTNKENLAILSFLRTESMKPLPKLAVEAEDYDSSCSETSSDSDSEDVPNLPMADQNLVDNIKHQSMNCIQENLITFEERLCKNLDANNGWNKLGKFIGFDESTLAGLKVISKGSSPTKIILNKVKKLYGCDQKTLENVLVSAGLEETTRMLRSLNI